MNLIRPLVDCDLNLTSFKAAVSELQHIEDVRIEVLLITHSAQSQLALKIKNHFEAIRDRGGLADGAFILPKNINIWYHDGLSPDCWLVLGSENIVYSMGA